MSTAPVAVALPPPTIQQLMPQQEDQSQHENRFLFTAWLPVNLVFDLTGIPSGWITPGVIQPIVDWSYPVPNTAAVDRVRPGDLDVKLGPQVPFLRSAGIILERIMANNAMEVGTEVGIPPTPTGLIEIKGLRGLNVWGNAKHHALWLAIQQWLWPGNYKKYADQFQALSAVSRMSEANEVLGLSPEIEARVLAKFPGDLDKFEDALITMHASLGLAAAYCKAKQEELLGELRDAPTTKGVKRRASPMDRKAIAWLGGTEPVAVPQQSSAQADINRMADMFQATVSTIGQMVQQGQGGGGNDALNQLAAQLAISNKLMMEMLSDSRGMHRASPLSDAPVVPSAPVAVAPPPIGQEMEFPLVPVEEVGVFTDDPDAEIPYKGEPEETGVSLQAVTDEPIAEEKPKNGKKK
jgi:hypothetical protein